MKTKNKKVSKVKKAEPNGSSGVMIALMLPEAVANAIALEGGEPAKDLHVTLLYIPGIATDEQARIKLQKAIAPFSELLAPLKMSIGGVGRFNASAYSDGKDVFYATPNALGLEALRLAVCLSVEKAGLLPPKKFGYTPHITLKYLEKGEDTPNLRISCPEFEVSKLSVASRNSSSEFEFNGTIILKADVFKGGPGSGPQGGSGSHQERSDAADREVQRTAQAHENTKAEATAEINKYNAIKDSAAAHGKEADKSKLDAQKKNSE